MNRSMNQQHTICWLVLLAAVSGVEHDRYAFSIIESIRASNSLNAFLLKSSSNKIFIREWESGDQ